MAEHPPTMRAASARARLTAAGGRLRDGGRWFTAHPARLLGVVIAVGVLLRLQRFGAPILDAHAFRQTQTASTVWLWNRDGYDLLDYRVPMFGGGNWVFELPVYQTLVWMLQVPAGGIEPAGRLVSIASYVAAAILMYLIGVRWFGNRVAPLLGVAVFTILPVTVFFFRALLIDTLGIATTLLTVYAAIRLAERFTWTWFAVFAAALVVSVLGKGTLVLAIGSAVVVVGIRILADRRVTLVQKGALVAAGLGAVVLSYLWTRHADELNLASDALTYSTGRDWFFGSTFTDPELFRTVGQRFLDNFGPVGLILVALGLASIPSLPARHRPEVVVTLVGAVLSIGIFANLNRVHDYYQLSYYVPLSWLAGLGLFTIYRLVRHASPTGARQVVAGLVIGLGMLWSITMWSGYFAPTALNVVWAVQGADLRANTPDARVLVIQEGGDKNEPMLWYEARRVGWRVPTSDAAQAQAIARDNPDIGAIVFLTGPSPEPPFVAELARARGFSPAFDAPGMRVYLRAGSETSLLPPAAGRRG